MFPVVTGRLEMQGCLLVAHPLMFTTAQEYFFQVMKCCSRISNYDHQHLCRSSNCYSLLKMLLRGLALLPPLKTG